MSQESWVPIKSYEGTYEVSDLGRVRSVPRIDALGRHKKGVVLSLWVDSKGRPHANLRQKRHTVSRLVLAAFVGPQPDGMEGCHNDGNPGNNRRGNLRWDTRSSNTKDAVEHGTHRQTKKTHCPQGHELAEDNLTIYAKSVGHRHCLKCQRAMSLESYYRNRPRASRLR